jgi:hypothetical protein
MGTFLTSFDISIILLASQEISVKLHGSDLQLERFSADHLDVAPWCVQDGYSIQST